MQFAQRQCCKQTKRVDMTAVIRYDHERAVGPQIFMADNLEMIVDVQQATNHERAERSHSMNEHVRLARKSTQTIDRRLIDIAH